MWAQSGWLWVTSGAEQVGGVNPMCSCSLVQSSSLIEPMIERVLPLFTMPAGGGEGWSQGTSRKGKWQINKKNCDSLLLMCNFFYTYKISRCSLHSTVGLLFKSYNYLNWGRRFHWISVVYDSIFAHHVHHSKKQLWQSDLIWFDEMTRFSTHT